MAAVLARGRARVTGSSVVEGAPSPERALAATVELDGSALLVGSMALPPASSPAWGPAQKVEQCRRIVAFLRSAEGPVIVGLDANTPRRDAIDLADTEFWNDGEEELLGPDADHGLRDVYRELVERDPARVAELRRERPDGPLAVSYVRRSRVRRFESRYDYILGLVSAHGALRGLRLRARPRHGKRPRGRHCAPDARRLRPAGSATIRSMQKRSLGASGIDVGAIGLGCMGMSWGYSQSQTDDAESIRVVHRALELGCTMLDTADAYGPFTNEELVGRALAGRREQAVVATKCGLVVHDAATYDMRIDGTPEHIREGLRRVAAPARGRHDRPLLPAPRRPERARSRSPSGRSPSWSRPARCGRSG